MLHVLGVDEDLEGAAAPLLHHVVDGDVYGVVAARPFDLVRAPRKLLRPVERRSKVDHIAVARRHRRHRLLGFRRLYLQHSTGHVVGTVGRAALAVLCIGLLVDALEGLEGNVARQVDGLGDRAVDMVLRRRLHREVIGGRQRLGIDEHVGWRRLVALHLAPDTERVVVDALLALGAVGLQHVAHVAEGEDRLDAGGHVVGQQGDRTGGRDRVQQRVADAVATDRGPRVFGQRPDRLARQIPGPFVEGETTLLCRDVGRGNVGQPLHRAQPFARQPHRLG